MDKPQAAEETKEPSRGRDTQNPAEAQKKDEKKKRTFVAPEPREPAGTAGRDGQAPGVKAQARPGRQALPPAPAGILRLQQLAGNTAVTRLLTGSETNAAGGGASPVVAPRTRDTFGMPRQSAGRTGPVVSRAKTGPLGDATGGASVVSGGAHSEAAAMPVSSDGAVLGRRSGPVASDAPADDDSRAPTGTGVALGDLTRRRSTAVGGRAGRVGPAGPTGQAGRAGQAGPAIPALAAYEPVAPGVTSVLGAGGMAPGISNLITPRAEPRAGRTMDSPADRQTAPVASEADGIVIGKLRRAHVQRQPDNYAKFTLKQLRELAVQDPEAAEALRQRFRSMPNSQLERNARTDPAAESAYSQRNVVPREAAGQGRLSGPGVLDGLAKDIRQARTQLRADTGITRRAPSAVLPGGRTQGGTMAAARTDIPGVERSFIGRSPGAGGRINPDSIFAPATDPALLPHTHGHAEQDIADQLEEVLRSVPEEQLNGRRVWILVEQEPCSTCAQGVGDSAMEAGVLRKLSQRFKGVIFEIKNADSSSLMVLRNGARVGVSPPTGPGLVGPQPLAPGALPSTAPQEGTPLTPAVQEGSSAVEAAGAGRAATAGVEAGEAAAGAVGGGARALGLLGRIGPALLEAAIFAVIAMGLDYLRRRAEQEHFRRRMSESGPEMDKALGKLGSQVEELQRTSGGRTVWAHMTIWITSHQTVSGGMGIIAYDYAFDDAGFEGATVGLDYLAGRSTKFGQQTTWPNGYGSSTITPQRELVTYSLPIPYRAAALDPNARLARIRNNEQDAARPDLPQPALDALYQERNALLAPDDRN